MLLIIVEPKGKTTNRDALSLCVLMYICIYVYIRHHYNNVYLGMSQIQNDGFYLMYWRALVKLMKPLRTGTIKDHG